MVCKQCQNCVFINDKQVQNGVADIGMGQPISSWDHHTGLEWVMMTYSDQWAYSI